MLRARIHRPLAVALVSAALLASCGSSGGSSDGSAPSSGDTSATTAYRPNTTPNGTTAQGKKTGKVRIFYAFEQGGQPGPDLDIYDTAVPGTDDKPLIEGLKYGELSDYVQPRSQYTDAGNLWAFAAGTKKKGTDVSDISGQSISANGFDTGTQQTVVIKSTTIAPGETKTQPSYVDIPEAGTGNFSVPDEWKPADGKGIVLANAGGVGADDSKLELYLAIDGECPKRVDTANSAGGAVESIANGNAVPYAVAAGSHELKLLAVTTDKALSTCDLSAARATATVDVTAGQRVEVFAYGASGDLDDIQLATTTVAD